MSWLSDLSKPQRTAITAATAGWAVDGFDFVLYSFVLPTLITAWGMSRSEAGLIATGALLASAFGGWIAGILADRYGRVKVLQLTILWFSVCTFLSGLTHSFEQLLVVRVLQGLGFGGEWTVGAVLVSEMMDAEHRGKAVGLMQSGYAVGWALATLVFAAMFSWFPEEYAWRLLFFVGLIPALLVVYVRRRVIEPATFVKSREAIEKAPHAVSALAIFRPQLLPTVALASLLAIGIQGAYYSVVTWLPTYLKSVRNLTVLNTGGYLLILIFGSFLGYLAGAAAMDRYGRRTAFIAFALLAAITSYGYFVAKLPDALVMLAGFPLGLTVSGMIGGLGAHLAELFPTPVRASAQGFAYNSGRVIAASFPPLIGFLSADYSLETMMGAFAMGSFACVIVATLLLPETRGRSLDLDYVQTASNHDAGLRRRSDG
jgi:MFS family permease